MSKGREGGTTPAPVEKVTRTVTSPYGGRPDAEMHTIGMAYFLGLVVLLIPLLPFLALTWLISKVVGSVARKAPTGSTRETSR